MATMNAPKVCLFVLVLATFAAAAPPTKVTLLEAKLLLHATPVAHEVRAKGHRVGFEYRISETFNHEDYFYLSLYNATDKVSASILVGHFIINKHTADVWNDSEEFIETLEMQEFQASIRAARGITKAVIKKYRDRPFYLPPNSKQPVSKQKSANGKLTLLEAKLLMHATPEAHFVRAEGHEIEFEVITADTFNNEDFYCLSIYNATRKGSSSTLVGHFIINKHTADILDDGYGHLFVTPEILELQTTIREARGITKAVIKQYRDRPTYVPPGSKQPDSKKEDPNKPWSEKWSAIHPKRIRAYGTRPQFDETYLCP